MADGIVVWFTGLPSSGKSTLAEHVAVELRRRNVATAELDGDALRGCFVPAHGYGESDRRDFYETLARLSALLAGQGLVVLVPATATRAAFRARGRKLWSRFVEVFVDVPLDVCMQRDTKGLYAAGRSALPGVDVTFERPAHPEVTVRSADPEDVDRVVRAIDAMYAGEQQLNPGSG